MNAMKAQSWLWPDRTIGKRESRKLREEHNALVNLNAELMEALKRTEQALAFYVEDKGESDIEALHEARAAIARATKQ